MSTFFKPFALALFLSGTLSVSAQTDSIYYYRNQASKIYRDAYDSLRKSDAYKMAIERWQYHANRSNGYSAFTLYGDLGRANYDVINKGIGQSGFPPLAGPQLRVGMGITTEYHSRTIFEFYFFTIGLFNKSKKGDSSIVSSYNNLLQFNFGYDFIRSNKINIYPYAGFALRNTILNYNQPDQVNNNFTSIVDIVQKEGATYGSKFNLSYQAGVGFDFVISESKKGGGIMLFTRAGTDGIIGSRDFKVKGLKYHTDIQQGGWQCTFGVKLFKRQ